MRIDRWTDTSINISDYTLHDNTTVRPTIHSRKEYNADVRRITRSPRPPQKLIQPAINTHIMKTTVVPTRSVFSILTVHPVPT